LQDSISAGAPVLVVDLDGTLSRTDTLHEAVLGMLARDPRALVPLIGAVLQRRSAFKAFVADRHIVPGSSLPLNPTVLDLVHKARAEGRRTAIVSASDRRQVRAVAQAVALFDDVEGSDPHQNLKGQAKARHLIDRYGDKGFDYVGDAWADLPVWSHARRAITVDASPKLRQAVDVGHADVLHLAGKTNRAAAALRAVRPHQWSKNLLVFLPLLAAHDISALGPALLAFAAFCCAAAAVYVINDLLDLEADRCHPRKRSRPFAAGDLTAADGVVMALALLTGAIVLSLMTGNPLFLGVLSVYLVSTFAYSLWLKRKLLVDVLALAGLYTVRIVAGGVAAGLVLSPWLLGFSMFLFLGLATVKRQAELMDQAATGRESSGRAYAVDDLPVLRGLALSSAVASILVLALYVSSGDVQPLYTQPDLLWALCPVLLYWLLRMIMIAHRGQMTDDPIVFAARDRVSQVTILVAFGIVVMASIL
jgi:4-hydroxybenzoate polyprenyltransferase/phosphoserine phosphatase